MSSSLFKPSISLLSIFLFISISLSSPIDTSTTNYDTHNFIITSLSSHDNDVMKIYESWLVKHRKNYNALDENEKRFQIFKDNLKYIEDRNSDESRTYKLGLNIFADLTIDEFWSSYLGPNRKPVVDRGQIDVTEDDQMILQKAVANQPVGIGAEDCVRDFQLYISGIFTGSCDISLDHNMVVVGYGTTEEGKDYCIVKMSWGANWGENGYIRMDRNIASKTSKGGMTTEPSYRAKTIHQIPHAAEVACDSYNSCPSQHTCCCVHTYGPYCFAWGCCPLKSAVCCDDHSQCCPRDHPICDASRNTCRESKNSPLSVKALKRTPAKLQVSDWHKGLI